MPLVDETLQVVASLEEFPVDRHEPIQQRSESTPEFHRVDAGPGHDVLFDHPRESRRHPESVTFDVVSHGGSGQWQEWAGRGQRLLREQIVVASWASASAIQPMLSTFDTVCSACRASAGI